MGFGILHLWVLVFVIVGFRVWGLGFRVHTLALGLGFRVSGLGYMHRLQGFRVIPATRFVCLGIFRTVII